MGMPSAIVIIPRRIFCARRGKRLNASDIVQVKRLILHEKQVVNPKKVTMLSQLQAVPQVLDGCIWGKSPMILMRTEMGCILA
jgi:hypothetical protein